jgi:DNA-binding MarR family transcriptional regulator
MAVGGRMKTYINGTFHLVRKGYDFNIRNFACLLAVYSRADLYTVRELAEFLEMSKPSVTRALDSLEKNEFIARIQDPEDRRSILIDRTDIGEGFVEIFRKALEGNPELEVQYDARVYEEYQDSKVEPERGKKTR